MIENQQKISFYKGAIFYQQFLESLSQQVSVKCDLESLTLSKALYYDLWQIQTSAWRYMIANSRPQRHSISEITQDLIAFYLRAALPAEYSVKLEAKGEHQVAETDRLPRVDIAIYKYNNAWVIIS